MAIIDRRGATVSATDAPSSSTPNADLGVKTAVRVASTGSNIDIQTFGLGVLDGIQLAAGDRVLLKDQTDPTQNGIYNASTGVWAMSSDLQNNSQVANGLLVFVNSGTLNAQTLWALNATDPVVLGTSQLSFVTRISNVSTTPYPVIHPSSGNFQGAGGIGDTPTAPAYLRSDQNAQLNADAIQFFSVDPSADVIITVGGSATSGDIVTLRFIFNSQTVPVSYTVKAGDTLASVVNGLIAAVQGNPKLFSPPNAVNRLLGGGYDLGALVGYIVVDGPASFAFDYNSTVNLTMSYSVSGAATETLTFGAGFFGNTYEAGGSTAGTVYQVPSAWDANPDIDLSRAVPGMVPPAGSVIGVINVSGADSSSLPLGTRNIGYGSIAYYVGDATHGHVQGAFIISAMGGGAFSNGGGGTWFGQGVYSNFGGAPFHGGVVDQGPGTFNAGVGYYINNTYSIAQSGSKLLIATNSSDPIELVSSGGIGFGGLPSANGECQSALGFFVSGSQVPATGSGLSVSFSAGAANVQAKNFGSSTFQLLNLQASTINLLPGGAQTGASVTTNSLYPTTDNVVLLGASTQRWSSFHTMGANFYGATSGSLLVKAAAIAGANTLTLPAGTTDFSATGGAGQVVKQTSAGGAFTVAQLAYADLPSIANNTLLGNSSGSSAAPVAQTLGATLAFSGSALQTVAHTGDVTTAANSFVTTVAKIAGTTVSGTTGSGNVVFAAAPTIAGPTITGTLTAAVYSGSDNFTITKATGSLSYSMTASASQVQVTFIGSGGVLYTLEDTAGGVNQKFFQWVVAGGLVTFRDLTDAPAVQHTFLTFNQANGVSAFPGAIAATSSTTGTVVVTGGLGASGAGYFGGALLSVSASGGIGYATGAGNALGVIAQITSRTTGITVNAPTGAFSLLSAAGSATPATLTVTNSAVAATDVIKVVQKSGTNLYEAFVTAVAAGSFNVTFFTTGGTATDAPVFNFVVIKAVTA